MHTNSKDIIKKEVPREGTWYQSGLDKGYVGHKAAKAMKRAKNIESRHQEAVSQKSELLHNIEQYDDLKISPLEFHKECLDSVDTRYNF